ncbi:MAG: phage terminase large subunit, partial [Culicoidibacterales bacterium]
MKSGAVRSGKTHLDIVFTIPMRIRERSKKKGLNVIFGNTQGSLKRNILEPLQQHWGNQYISNINSENIATIFGEKVYFIGASKKNQAEVIRGSEIKYAYCDELVTYHQDVFEMLKSRLSLDYSVCDITCNPEGPNHWVKQFIDTPDIDAFIQQYTIWDNTFLPKKYVDALETEYKGTIYFDRLLKGLWKHAEGIVFPQFASNPEKYRTNKIPVDHTRVSIGFDVGGTKSHSTFVAVAFNTTFTDFTRIAEKKIIHGKGTIEPEDLYNAAFDFIDSIQEEFGLRTEVFFVDCAEQLIANGMNKRLRPLGINVKDSKKTKSSDRILLYTQLFGNGKGLFLNNNLPILTKSLC